MTTFEMISILLSAASLLIAAGMFVIALLAYLDQRNKRKK